MVEAKFILFFTSLCSDPQKRSETVYLILGLETNKSKFKYSLKESGE